MTTFPVAYLAGTRIAPWPQEASQTPMYGNSALLIMYFGGPTAGVAVTSIMGNN